MALPKFDQTQKSSKKRKTMGKKKKEFIAFSGNGGVITAIDPNEVFLGQKLGSSLDYSSIPKLFEIKKPHQSITVSKLIFVEPNLLVSGSYDKKIKVWELMRANSAPSAASSSSEVENPKEPILKKTISIFNDEIGVLKRLPWPKKTDSLSQALSITEGQRSNQIVTASLNDTIKVLNLQKEEQQGVVAEIKIVEQQLESNIESQGASGRPCLWDFAPVMSEKGHMFGVACCINEQELKVVDIENAKHIVSLQGHQKNIRFVLHVPQFKLLFSFDESGLCFIWSENKKFEDEEDEYIFNSDSYRASFHVFGPDVVITSVILHVDKEGNIFILCGSKGGSIR